MTISGDVSNVRAFARTWAADHPIRYAIAGRETALGRVLERDAATFHSTGEIAAEVTTAVDDLGRRMELYSDQLFRQARWEAELFKSELLSDLKPDQLFPLAERAVNSAERAVAAVDRLAPPVDRALHLVDRLAPPVERALGVVEGAPALLLAEREAVIKVLRAELTRTIDFVQEERIAALQYVSNERIVALAAMRETMAEERRALTQDIEQISLKVVDHAFWRAAQLLALVCVAMFVALTAAFFALKRSPEGGKSSGTAGGGTVGVGTPGGAP